jgi:hypothetical protein
MRNKVFARDFYKKGSYMNVNRAAGITVTGLAASTVAAVTVTLATVT